MSRRARRYAEATAAKRGDFMAQDLSPGLTAWLAVQPDVRLHARDAAKGIAPEPAATCTHCGGTGGDPWNDGITPCEHCDGEGYEWWN